MKFVGVKEREKAINKPHKQEQRKRVYKCQQLDFLKGLVMN